MTTSRSYSSLRIAPAAPAFTLMNPAFVRLLCMQVAFGLSFSIFLILPKHLAVTLHARPSQLGWIMSMYGVANIVFARPITWFMNRAGRKRAVQMGTLCAALGALVFVFADQANWFAALGRLLQGLAWALVFTAGTAMAADLAPADRMGQAMGVFASAVLVTNALGPPVAEPLMISLGAAPVFLVGVVAALVAFALARRLPDDALSVTPIHAKAGASRLPLRFVAVWVTLGLACGTMATFSQPLAILNHVPRVSDFFLGYTATALAVRVLAGRLLDRVGYRRACAVSFVLYALVVYSMRWLGPQTVVLLGGAFGLAHGTFYPAMMALSVASVTPQARGALMSTVNVAFHAGAMSVVALGYLAEFIGLPRVFLGAAIVTFLSGWWLRGKDT